MEIALLGHMGRDDALADRLMEHKLHVIGQWPNPGLVSKLEATGGKFFKVDSIKNVENVADIVQALESDMFISNFDDALAIGVVDVIRNRVVDKKMNDLLIPCPDRASSRPEWDKFFCRRLVEMVDPDYNPLTFMVENLEEAERAIDTLTADRIELVIKPRGLTGGKGVKVQGEHFDTSAEAKLYVREVLTDSLQQGVEVQEKLQGYEFTLQLLTDGETIIEAPATYDYPYREDGDHGPGTGGMGAFSMAPGELLPFLTPDDYKEALAFSNRLLEVFHQSGLDFKGILYPSFMKTKDGLKLIEVNARGGDPELINILDLMEDDVDVARVFCNIAKGELTVHDVRYKNAASTMVYMVAPDYGYTTGPAYSFGLDPEVISSFGCQLRFAAAENYPGTSADDHIYQTVGASRTVGLSALASTPWEARKKIQEAIEYGFTIPLDLDSRKEVGQEAYIKKLIF